MKLIRVVLPAVLTLALTYALNRSWNLGDPIPPLGKFLDPFHGFWHNAESAQAGDAELSIPGLKDKVTVVYDSVRIPHVFASNDDDLYFAQGYITAVDRLWQMEFQTHAAAGRISEIIGSATLDYDRRQRRLGMIYGAENGLASMEKNPVSKAMVDAYTAGINAYIQTLSYEDLPLEYKLLDYAPEPWSNIKSALLLKYMAQTLNMSDKDLEMTNALKLFGKETIELLYPDQEQVGDPIVDRPGEWKFKTTIPDSIPLAVPTELIARKPFEKPSPDVGSNNWAVSGSKTASGSPILCSDPHLTLNLPSIWYTIHLSAPGCNTMGVSLPGSPGVIIGFNDSIAWAMTNAQRDLVDWYQIQFKDNTKSEYMSDGAWKPSRKLIETIKVKGSATVLDTVTYTHHGPVLYDETFHGESERAHYAFRWVAHDPSEEVMTFYKMNRAKSHGDYMEALNYYSSPAQNFVFASVSGDVAMRIQGKYPVRRKNEGRFVLDGTKTSTEWKAFIPNEHNVMDKNPKRGFVSSANQYPVDFTYPYYVTGSSFEAYRNRRINQVLTAASNVTVADMIRLQQDNFHSRAAESLPTFLTHLDTTSFTEQERNAYRILRGWDYFSNIESVGPSYCEAWWRALLPMIWDELDSAHVALQDPTSFTTIQLIKTQPTLSFFDLVATPEKETATDLLRMSFTKGVGVIEEWKAKNGKEPQWADYKDGYIAHLTRQDALSRHVRHGGGSAIVNAFTRTHGPSWRMVVSLDKTGVNAVGVYPGGQSGNPGSPYYANFIDPWATAKYFNMHFVTSPDQLASYKFSSTQLSPSK
ncbi:MAG: penicillin acylase family protein [Cyclobacteriaceae bacterium]|nr:penicillin acylase family protein [Cyclobacteriaceae bacterium]